LKATNIAQQLGGAMTYSKRYLLMNAYDISDNNLDFDSKNNAQNNAQNKQWLNKWNKDHTQDLNKYWEVVNRAKNKNYSISDLLNHYKISKEVQKELQTDLNL